MVPFLPLRLIYMVRVLLMIVASDVYSVHGNFLDIRLPMAMIVRF